jgi:hypothetical protein
MQYAITVQDHLKGTNAGIFLTKKICEGLAINNRQVRCATTQDGYDINIRATKPDQKYAFLDVFLRLNSIYDDAFAMKHTGLPEPPAASSTL